MKYGEIATANPWGAHGLEWEVDSPPITTNFEKTPIVTDEVYDFSSIEDHDGPAHGEKEPRTEDLKEDLRGEHKGDKHSWQP